MKAAEKVGVHAFAARNADAFGDHAADADQETGGPAGRRAIEKVTPPRAAVLDQIGNMGKQVAYSADHRAAGNRQGGATQHRHRIAEREPAVGIDAAGRVVACINIRACVLRRGVRLQEAPGERVVQAGTEIV